MHSLKLRKYCEGCPNFEPKVGMEIATLNGIDKKITCENVDLCLRLYQFLKKKIEDVTVDTAYRTKKAFKDDDIDFIKDNPSEETPMWKLVNGQGAVFGVGLTADEAIVRYSQIVVEDPNVKIEPDVYHYRGQP